jgi:hypothetical protein
MVVCKATPLPDGLKLFNSFFTLIFKIIFFINVMQLVGPGYENLGHCPG